MASDVPISDVEIEGLGPAMLACDERQRRFVVGMIGSGCKNAARVAKAAGYSDSSGAAKVTAHRLLRNQRVISALREEAERRFETTAVEAMIGLGKLVSHKDTKTRLAAIDSVLDRSGFSRRTTQDIRVEQVDNRSTAELLRLVQQWAPAPMAIVDTTAEDVPSG